MRIEREASVTQLEHNMVAVGILQGDSGRLTGHLVVVLVNSRDDRGVGDGAARPAMRWIAIGQGGITAAEPVLRVKLVEVDGEAPRQVEAAIDRLRRPAVRTIAARSTAAHCHVT